MKKKQIESITNKTQRTIVISIKNKKNRKSFMDSH